MTDPHGERTALLAALTVATLAATVLIFVHSGARPRVSPGLLAALAVPWLAFSIVLRLRPDDLGREGTYVDLWSISHLVGGAVLALLGIPLAWIAAIAIGWELVELAARVREHPGNRVVDVVLAVAGGAVAIAWLAPSPAG